MCLEGLCAFGEREILAQFFNVLYVTDYILLMTRDVHLEGLRPLPSYKLQSSFCGAVSKGLLFSSGFDMGLLLLETACLELLFKIWCPSPQKFPENVNYETIKLRSQPSFPFPMVVYLIFSIFLQSPSE